MTKLSLSHGLLAFGAALFFSLGENSTGKRLAAPLDPTVAPTPVPRVSLGPIRVELEQIASGVTAPNDLTSVGDGRLFFDEQGGGIRIVEAGALLVVPFLDVSARLIGSGDERGLLGFTFHPGYKDPSSPGLCGGFSTRLRVETGDNVLVSGFIITGSDSEEVVLRGLGPSLSMRDVAPAETLLDPMIELYDSSGAMIASNDGWVSGPQASEIIGLGLAPDEPSEAALVAKLPPGSYTAILSDAQGGSGIGIVELYATSVSAPANPVNISTRGLVGKGDDVMIGGFIIGGMNTSRLVIRALGPSLKRVGDSQCAARPDPRTARSGWRFDCVQ